MIIQWSNQARKDLRAIHSYIARDSVVYASGQISRIISRVEKASARPSAGHPVHEYTEMPLREIHEGNYRIIYSVESKILQVITIVHMRQRLSRRRLG